MARSPDIAFWYYARAVACTEDDIIRWAKLGLKRKRTTPYVRQGLLEIAADNAARIGFERLKQANPGSEEYVPTVTVHQRILCYGFHRRSTTGLARTQKGADDRHKDLGSYPRERTLT